MAVRTPLQRARKGGFKDMSVQELLIAFFKVRPGSRPRVSSNVSSWPSSPQTAIPEMKIDPALIGDISVGASPLAAIACVAPAAYAVSLRRHCPPAQGSV